MPYHVTVTRHHRPGYTLDEFRRHHWTEETEDEMVESVGLTIENLVLQMGFNEDGVYEALILITDSIGRGFGWAYIDEDFDLIVSEYEDLFGVGNTLEAK